MANTLGSYGKSPGTPNALLGKPEHDQAPLSPSAVTEAVAAVMRESNPNGIVDRDLAAQIGGNIRPALEKALGGKAASGSELLASGAFRAILTQHLGSSSSAQMDDQARKAMLRVLESSNISSSGYASAQRGLESLGSAGGRAISSAERSRAMGSGDERAGLSSNDYNALAKQFGSEALATALDQAKTIGITGKHNIALLAEFKEVAGALASGNMDEAWALYHAEKDPEKQRRILQLIQAAIDARNKNNKELKAATKSLSPADAARVHRTVDAYVKNSGDPEARKAFEKLQTEYKDNKGLSKALHKTKEDNDRLAKAKAEQDKKNATKAAANGQAIDQNRAVTDRVTQKAEVASSEKVATNEAKAKALASLGL